MVHKKCLAGETRWDIFSLIRQLFSLWGEIRGNRLWRGCDSLSEYDIVVVERKCTDSLSKGKTEDKGRDT